MQTVQGNLVFIGLNTAAPRAFFNGVEIADLRDVRTDWDSDDPRVKIKVGAGANSAALLDALRTAGVVVKEAQS